MRRPSARVGCSCKTELSLERGDLVKVRFRVPGNETLHELSARVTWHHEAHTDENGELRTPGVGLQFTDQTATAELARELEDYPG